MGGRGKTDAASIVPTNAGFIQDMGGRVTRYPLRRSEKTEPTASTATCSSASAGWTP